MTLDLEYPEDQYRLRGRGWTSDVRTLPEHDAIEWEARERRTHATIGVRLEILEGDEWSATS